MKTGDTVYRHSVVARTSHWLWTIAMLVLFMSGLQIFNAAPYLDASDKSDPTKRVLSIEGGTPSGADAPIGRTVIFGHPFNTTGVLGYTSDGSGGMAQRAFPGSITLPGYQSLADGRRWHLFFGWFLTLSLFAYVISGVIRKDIRELWLTKRDIAGLIPMQLYYLRLRKEKPPHGTYNPLQKVTYLIVLFVMMPLIILSGLALSPGIDAIASPLVSAFGGRQFARLWHFAFMTLFILYFFTHMILVFATGAWNNLRSMITGWYRLHDGDGVGI